MNQTVVNKIEVSEYEPKLQFLRRNSMLVKPVALVCQVSIDSKVDQIYHAKYK